MSKDQRFKIIVKNPKSPKYKTYSMSSQQTPQKLTATASERMLFPKMMPSSGSPICSRRIRLIWDVPTRTSTRSPTAISSFRLRIIWTHRCTFWSRFSDSINFLSKAIKDEFRKNNGNDSDRRRRIMSARIWREGHSLPPHEEAMTKLSFKGSQSLPCL